MSIRIRNIDGQTMTEYALILATVAAIVVSLFQTSGTIVQGLARTIDRFPVSVSRPAATLMTAATSIFKGARQCTVLALARCSFQSAIEAGGIGDRLCEVGNLAGCTSRRRRGEKRMKRPVIFVALAGLAAMLASVVVYSALKKREAEVQRAMAKTVYIVVAATDLPLGSKIDPGELKLARWSADAIPGRRLHQSQPGRRRDS